MSYNTDLEYNNTSLQEILATVNSLPEAGGSSGGGAEIETCPIDLQSWDTSEGTCVIVYTCQEEGSIITKTLVLDENIDTGIDNPIVGTDIIIFYIQPSDTSLTYVISPTFTNAGIYFDHLVTDRAFKATIPSGFSFLLLNLR